MVHLIDKDALVAEIERLQDSIKTTAIDGMISKEQAEAYRVCVKLISFVEDSLEVKDIDLDKEIDNYWDKICDNEFGELIERNSTWFDNIAKHFFELGLKAKKGE